MAATPAQSADIQRATQALEAYMRGAVARAVLRRQAFWLALRNSVPYSDLGQDVLALNSRQDDAAARFADIVRGLESGAYQVVAWTEPAEASGLSALRLGVVRAGAVPTGLGIFPIVAGVILVGVAAVGSWVLLDAWLAARKVEADADMVRAQTASAVTKAVTQAAATDPVAAKQLADSLQQAVNAAQNVQPGLLDRIGQTLKSGGEALESNALLILAVLWGLSRRGHA